MGKKVKFEDAWKSTIEVRTEFSDNIAICLGAQSATPEELQKAINQVFCTILAYRNGNRITGAFVESDLEHRIRQLEEGLEKVNNLVEEIVEWLTGLPPERGKSNGNNKPVP